MLKIRRESEPCGAPLSCIQSPGRMSFEKQEDENNMIPIGSSTQLFIDYKFIESHENICLRVNPPKKIGAAILPDHPWEEHCVSGFGTVMEEEGRYRLWYSASPGPERELPEILSCPKCGEKNVLDELYSRVYRCHKCLHRIADSVPWMAASWKLCHAISEDGLNWEKPDLGLVEFRGSKHNNIVDIQEAGVFQFNCMKDPNASAEKRYRLIDMDNSGMFLQYSHDGLQWTADKRYLFPPFTADNPNQLLWDERLNKYVAYIRGFPGKRVIVRCELDDPDHVPWPHSPSAENKNPDLYGARYITTELPTVIATDDLDPQPSDIMTQCVVPYPYAEDVYFAFPSIFRWYPGVIEAPAGREHHRFYQDNNNGPLEVQLFVSRDGKFFYRPERTAYVSLGVSGEKDSGCVYNMLAGMIRRDDKIYQYYTAREIGHAPRAYRDVRFKMLGMIGITEQYLDRFVGVYADRQGTFMTPPLVFSGRQLQLNIDCGAMGEAFVELRDESNFPISGYAFSDCDPIDLNSLRHIVSWRGKTEVSRYAGKPVRLRIKLKSARLYSFQFIE